VGGVEEEPHQPPPATLIDVIDVLAPYD
jgi:hypothetical protein